MSSRSDYREVLEQVCTSVIATEAAGVDRGAVFPEKSIAALKGAGLLGVGASGKPDAIGPHVDSAKSHGSSCCLEKRCMLPR